MERDFPAATGAHPRTGTLSGGGRNAPGPGRADGRTFGHAGGGSPDRRPRFDAPVPPNGYRWWYIDGLSDDGLHGLTIIGFVGSVFSPYYFQSRKHGSSDPEDFCSINVALYGPKRRWVMTECGKRFVTRDEHQFQVGPSNITWVGDSLVIHIDERCVPLPFRLRGTVTLHAAHIYGQPVALDSGGKHFWQAVAPHARLDVALTSPQLHWQGSGYHDMNWGEDPIENGFASWTWQRMETEAGSAVFYNALRRDNTRSSFGLAFSNGAVEKITTASLHHLPKGLWRVERQVTSETKPTLLSSLEDTPFYTRNHVRITYQGETLDGIHENLNLDRFKNPLVQKMLPYRMLRKA